jgi:hypothetical protein
VNRNVISESKKEFVKISCIKGEVTSSSNECVIVIKIFNRKLFVT